MSHNIYFLSELGTGGDQEFRMDHNRQIETPMTSSEGPSRASVEHGFSRLTKDDLYLFNEGSHTRLYDKLGSHFTVKDGVEGTYFAVWAPDAEQVSVMGDFNGWATDTHALQPRGMTGIWEGFIPGVMKGALYKYFIRSRHQGYQVQKTDPYAKFFEAPPRTASIVWDLDYEWQDRKSELRAIVNSDVAEVNEWARENGVLHVTRPSE